MSNEPIPFRGIRNDEAVYRPLQIDKKEIRYLSVHPGFGDAEVVCSLEYISLADVGRTTKYEALSYTWGDLEDLVDITLHSRPLHYRSCTITRFRVTPNLEIALKSLRYRDRPRALWVDAICINQMDAVERTQQVQIMGQIYESSARVVVWLGEGDLFSIVGLQAAQLIFPLLRRREDLPDDLRAKRKGMVEKVASRGRLEINVSPEDELNLWKEVEGRTSFTDEVIAPLAVLADDNLREKVFRILALMDISWATMHCDEQVELVCWIVSQCVNELLALPWFRRIWVMQEIFRAPVNPGGYPSALVHLGGLRILWEDLCSIVSTFSRFHFQSTPTTFGLLSANQNEALNFFQREWGHITVMTCRDKQARLEKTAGIPFRIIDILRLTQAFEATDSRDKLFAVLHLASDTIGVLENDNRIRPNYLRSTTQILIDFMAWYLETAADLNLFCFLNPARKLSTRPDEPPTWIPDLFEPFSDWPFAELASRPGEDKLTPCMGVTESHQQGIRPTVQNRSLFISGCPLSVVSDVISSELEYDREAHFLGVEKDEENNIQLFNFLLNNFWHRSKERSDVKFIIDCLPMLGCFSREDSEAEGFVAYFNDLRAPIVDKETWHAFEWDYYNAHGTSVGFCKTAGRFIKDRRIFMTVDGNLGLCPMSTRKDDVVVALQGSIFPLVLRSAGPKYQLLGTCIFHGKKWMNGEAGKYQKEMGLPLEMFELI